MSKKLFIVKEPGNDYLTVRDINDGLKPLYDIKTPDLLGVIELKNTNIIIVVTHSFLYKVDISPIKAIIKYQMDWYGFGLNKDDYVGIGEGGGGAGVLCPLRNKKIDKR